MDDVAHHIAKAHSEVDNVHISAKKMTARFGQIEKVELENIAVDPIAPALPVEADDSI